MKDAVVIVRQVPLRVSQPGPLPLLLLLLPLRLSLLLLLPLPLQLLLPLAEGPALLLEVHQSVPGR